MWCRGWLADEVVPREMLEVFVQVSWESVLLWCGLCRWSSCSMLK